MKWQYFIRQEKGAGIEIWHGPYEITPVNKLKSILNNYDDFTVYRCQVVGIDWEKI